MPTLNARETNTELSVAEATADTAKTITQPGQWRRFRNTVARHPKLTQLALLLTLAGGTSIVLLTLLFRGAWSGHQDNLAILSTILKMELSRADSLPLNTSPLKENEQRLVTRTFSTLEPHLETDGWAWINRFGSTMTYGKQDQRLIVSCSPYSPLYIICDLSEIP